MATTREIEDMNTQMRREGHNVTDADWQHMALEADAVFDGAARARGNERFTGHDELAARELARTMATVQPHRANPFQSAELRETYDTERLELAHGVAFEAGRHGDPIPEGIAESRLLLNGYRAGLDDRATGLAYARDVEGAGETDRDYAELAQRREEVGQALSRLPEGRHNDMGVSNPEWARAVQAAELTIESRHMNDPQAADPVMGMGIAIPASKQFAAYECQSAPNIDPLSAPKSDPLGGTEAGPMRCSLHTAQPRRAGVVLATPGF